ncbi:MAG TPA: Hsp70 family protein [Roseiflexaceae bacterium]|nr:Hsp70 family protein [Roseiflexaceae bacterium]
MHIGLDFGTTTTVASVFDGRAVRLIPLDPADVAPEVMRSVLLISREGDVLVGRAAIDCYVAGHVGREVIYRDVVLGTIQMHFADLTITRDVHAIVDANVPSRLFQSLKTALRDPSYQATDVFGARWTVEQVVAAYLREVRRRVEEQLGEPVTGVTVGRPVHLTDNPRHEAAIAARLERALELAGFPAPRLLPEPVAAAYAFAQTIDGPQTVFVFDFGGGTLDTTVMRLDPRRAPEVLATGGISIGGDLLDSRIVTGALLPYFGAGATLGPRRLPLPAFILEHLADWQSIVELNRPGRWEVLEQAVATGDRPRELRALRALVRNNYGLPLFTEVELAKRRLSSERTALIAMDVDAIGLRHELERAEFERLIGPETRAIAACVDGTLRDAGLAPDQIDVALRTGGSSRIPRFVRMLRERFGEERLHAMDAFTSVGAGLGVAAFTQRARRASAA